MFGAVVPESTAGSLKEIEPSEFFITSEDTATGASAVVPLAAAAPVLPAVPLVVVEAPELVAGAVVAAMLAGAAGLEAPVPAAGAVVARSEAPVLAAGSATVTGAAGASVVVPAAGSVVPLVGAASVLVAAGLPVSSALTLKGVAAITPVTASAAT